MLTSTVFISRETYNRLIERYPQWMKEVWPTFKRKWDAGGVTVQAHLNKGHHHSLLANLKAVR